MINRCRPTAEGDSRRELANALARGGSRSVQGRRASDTDGLDGRLRARSSGLALVCRCPIPDPKMLRPTICSGSFQFSDDR